MWSDPARDGAASALNRHAPGGPATTLGPGLLPGQFRQVAREGFGDSRNAYPHAMAWFEDHLYVGTTRCVLALLFHSTDTLDTLPVLPVKPAPRNPYVEYDVRSRIWRYHPPTDTWEEVYVSPLMPPNKDGDVVPMFHGVRNMIVYRRPSDERAALYVMTWSPKGGGGARFLRSEDGRRFETLEIPVVSGDTKKFTSFRPLAEFKGLLFTAPSGREGDPNNAGGVIIFQTDDPVNKRWVQVNETSFGNPHNKSTAEMCVFDDHLYVGMQNPDGFEIWKTDGEGEPPYRWTPVITGGAGRGPRNETASALCVLGDHLYVGTAITHGGYDRKHGIGPAPVEVLRIARDDSWELVVGEPRQVDGRVVAPLSGMGPGFDKYFNTYLWRMCVHEGWLYAGTFASSGLLPFVPPSRIPESKAKLLDPERMERLVRHLGGFDLWRTRDGVVWLPVTRNGFGNPFNYGVRTLESTPYGLFVGCANPFGPEVAVKRAAGWQYEPNERGGCEIWMGSSSRDVAIRRTVRRGDGSVARVPPPAQPRLIGIETPDDTEERAIAEFYGDTGFRSFGAWDDTTHGAAEACRNLVVEVLSLVPGDATPVLDASGQGGAVARETARLRPSADVKALFFDRAEWRRAETSLPAGSARHQSSARRALPRRSLGAVVVLDSLVRRTDAVRWLETFRHALAPGGTLAGSTVLSSNRDCPWRIGKEPVRTAERFAELLERAGFEDVKVVSMRRRTWVPFREQLSIFLWGKALDNELDPDGVGRIKERLYGPHEPILDHVVFGARSPGGG